MSTKVYGASDDLIEFEGDVTGEVGCYGTDDKEKGVLLIFGDNTILEVKYGKMGMGLWEVRLRKRGDLFEKIETKMEEDDEGHSDIAYFKDGLKWAFAATKWEHVQ